jgi:hypothetical protein
LYEIWRRQAAFGVKHLILFYYFVTNLWIIITSNRSSQIFWDLCQINWASHAVMQHPWRRVFELPRHWN